MELGSIVVWIIVGLIAGFLASKVVSGHGMGVIWDIVVGILGAFVGGWIAGLMGFARHLLPLPAFVGEQARVVYGHRDMGAKPLQPSQLFRREGNAVRVRCGDTADRELCDAGRHRQCAHSTGVAAARIGHRGHRGGTEWPRGTGCWRQKPGPSRWGFAAVGACESRTSPTARPSRKKGRR